MAVFTAGNEHAGMTLAAFLRRCAADVSWAQARRHIHGRRVTVNRVVCVDDARRIAGGDRVELLSQSTKPLPSAGDVEVVYKDDDLMVIEKPAGMECERRREQRSWSQEKRSLHPTVVEALAAKGTRTFPVHRLDRDTSGLMLYALNPQTQQQLIRQIASHEARRIYLAVAMGQVASGQARTWIVRDRGDGLRGSVAAGTADAQEAITDFVAKESIAGGRYTALECSLQTGRTHQIRIHLAELGHPICGEKLYLSARAGAAPVRDNSGAPRQALHSAKLELRHPSTGKMLTYQSAWPRELGSWLARLSGK